MMKGTNIQKDKHKQLKRNRQPLLTILFERKVYQTSNQIFHWNLSHTSGLVGRGLQSHTYPSLKPYVQACTYCMHEFLLGVLQHMTFIFYLTESLACLKFHLRKPKHLPYKKIFVANLIFFCFHSFDFLFKKQSLFS